MKILSGKELVGFIKERQALVVAAMKQKPKLVIIRDNDDPVIAKYVNLKKCYGEDIGVEVADVVTNDVKAAILAANEDTSVSGIIVQLPLQKGPEGLKGREVTDNLVSLIAPEKDVDGLSGKGKFESATATAINWLLTGYNIDLASKKIAMVGYGRLVGAPLVKMWRNSGLDVTVFEKQDDLNKLVEFDLVVSATGVPRLIRPELVRAGATIVDAGTASENGVLVGDVAEKVRKREDLNAITPIIGGVGPLTVGVLFDSVIRASQDYQNF